MWRRCCPPSAEGVACCQSPHKLRGAAAVLSFFSARAEEVARCQCLRGWAQAVGRVTPSWDGGPPWCSWGMWQEGQPLCRGGQGASARTIFRLRAERLPTLFHKSLLGERMLPNKVTSARGIHAMPAGVVGVGAYTLHSFSLEILARTCWGRDYPDMTQKTNPPGTLRKKRRTFLPLATIQPRAERTPTSCLTYAGGTRPRGRTLGRVAWGERKPWLSTAAHSGSHTAPSPGGLPAVRDRGEVRP